MSDPKTPVVKEHQEDEVTIEINSITKELKKQKFSDEDIELFQRLSYEISIVGLSEEEACLMVNYDFEKLVQLRTKNKTVDRLFKLKNLEYKRGMLKTLSQRARAGDDKLALWLLEAKYPEEFNRRKGTGGGGDGDGEDMLGAALEFVRTNTDASGLIRQESARALVFKAPKTLPKGTTPQDLLKRATAKAEEIAKKS